MWVNFLREKLDTYITFERLCLQLQREKGREIDKIVRICSNHRSEFENSSFPEFFSYEGIAHEFSELITLKQNGVVEHENITLQEMSRVMLHAKKKLPYYLWVEAMNTTCHIHNRVTIYHGTKVTHYDL